MSILDQNRGRKTYSFFRTTPVASPTTIVSGSTGVIVTGNKDQITISADPNLVTASVGTFNTLNLTPTQTIVKKGWPIYEALGTGWGLGSFGVLAGPGTTAPQAVILNDLITSATLSSVTFSLAVSGSHAGGAPLNYPVFQIYKIDTLISSTWVAATVIGGVTFATSSYPTGASWFESGHIKEIVCPVTATVIDRNRYTYAAIITDENGTNSQSGTNYIAVASKMVTTSTMPVLPT